MYVDRKVGRWVEKYIDQEIDKQILTVTLCCTDKNIFGTIAVAVGLWAVTYCLLTRPILEHTAKLSKGYHISQSWLHLPERLFQGRVPHVKVHVLSDVVRLLD